MKLEERTATYSRETLERLTKVLAKYQVLPWLNPATNSISIKELCFVQNHPFTQEELVQKQTMV